MLSISFGLVFAFTDMVVIFVLTRGGPYDTTQVLANLAFFTGIQGGDLSAGAAIARKVGLAAFDFDHGTLLLTEAATQKRASLHVVRCSRTRPLPHGYEVRHARSWRPRNAR